MFNKKKQEPKYHDTWNRYTKQVERKPGRGIDVDEKFLKFLAVTAIASIGLAIGSEVIDGPPDHYEATITGKYYDDPDIESHPFSTGKTIGVRHTHDDAHWNIEVETHDNEDNTDETYTVEVKEKQFDKLAVGDKVHVDNDVITLENND